MSRMRTMVFTDDQLEQAVETFTRDYLANRHEPVELGQIIRDFMRSDAARKLYVMSTHPVNDPGRGD